MCNFIIVILLLVFELTDCRIHLCSKRDCHFDCDKRCSPGDTIICTNKVRNCYINCGGKNRNCKDSMNIYSNAYNTRVDCLEDDSCKDGLLLYCGNFLPANLLANKKDMVRKHYDRVNKLGYNKCTVNCGKIGCLKSRVFCKGDIKQGCYINAFYRGSSNFKDSFLECHLKSRKQPCYLNCGNDGTCSGANFNCYGGNCKCNGSGCHKINYYSFTKRPTNKPTNPTRRPTPPTQRPTNKPTTRKPTKKIAKKPGKYFPIIFPTEDNKKIYISTTKILNQKPSQKVNLHYFNNDKNPKTVDKSNSTISTVAIITIIAIVILILLICMTVFLLFYFRKDYNSKNSKTDKNNKKPIESHITNADFITDGDSANTTKKTKFKQLNSFSSSVISTYDLNATISADIQLSNKNISVNSKLSVGSFQEKQMLKNDKKSIFSRALTRFGLKKESVETSTFSLGKCTPTTSAQIINNKPQNEPKKSNQTHHKSRNSVQLEIKSIDTEIKSQNKDRELDKEFDTQSIKSLESNKSNKSHISENIVNLINQNKGISVNNWKNDMICKLYNLIVLENEWNKVETKNDDNSNLNQNDDLNDLSVSTDFNNPFIDNKTFSQNSSFSNKVYSTVEDYITNEKAKYKKNQTHIRNESVNLNKIDENEENVEFEDVFNEQNCNQKLIDTHSKTVSSDGNPFRSRSNTRTNKDSSRDKNKISKPSFSKNLKFFQKKR